MTIKLIIGLRNPGSAYEHTRHNAGEWFATALAEQNKTHFRLDKKMQAEVADLEIDQHLCKLIIPITFMNHSGQPVQLISQFYRIPPEELLVVHDDLDLVPGRIKLKKGGGHGGHNGIRDIASRLGSPEFHRLRLGIGHPGHRDLVHQYVLSKPSAQDREQIYNAIERGITALPLVLSGDLARAMNHLGG